MSFYDHYVYYRDNIDELKEKVKQTNTSKEIVINVPDFVLCGSDEEEEKNKNNNNNINNNNINNNNTYTNSDLPEFAL